MTVSKRTRAPQWGLCGLFGVLCLLLGGCIPFLNILADDWPGPKVVNRFATDVEVEIRLTDGTVRHTSYKPCNGYSFFGSQPSGYVRTVFVERLTFRRDGAVIGDYEGAKVEALGARGGVAVLDPSGLWRLTGVIRKCARVVNTLTTDVRVVAVYGDGSSASLTLRPCEPHVWTGLDPLRDRELQADDASPTHLTVSRGGEVIHELDERAIRKTFKHLRSWNTTTYTIGESAIGGKEGHAPPRGCLRRDVTSAAS